MQCPKCQNTNTRVLESRVPKDGKSVRRRRECLHCGQRFTTYERVEEMPLLVVAPNGSREPFDRQRLVTALETACQDIADIDSAEEIADAIEQHLQRNNESEIPQSRLDESILEALRRRNEVAYLRFAIAHYRYQTLQEVEDLIATLNKLRAQPPRGGGSSVAISP